MNQPPLDGLCAEIGAVKKVHSIGRVTAVSDGYLTIDGLESEAKMGDRLCLNRHDGQEIEGEVLRLSSDSISMLPDTSLDGIALDDRVSLLGEIGISPGDHWIGRVIDPFGRPLDGRPLVRGAKPRDLRNPPPEPSQRRGFGPRLDTGLSVLNTLLPIVQGQRVGLFAGSGVGKSSMIGHLAKDMQADVVVIALIGERGRELRDFVHDTLGPEAMKRSVVVAATSDRSPLVRRRCAWVAMSVAEHFRDQGLQVLFLADSITRFAEAHREVAIAGGEIPSMRGFPPSTAQMIMALCERAGPGSGLAGDITALFSVLVAGSDMEEPIADILRGVLDGHVILDRQIAERGRFPAIDLLRSVSRSLPAAATDSEQKLISETRQLLSAYEQAETMIKAGLYSKGSDPLTDHAIRAWPELDKFLAEPERLGIDNSFARLEILLRRAARPDLAVGGPSPQSTGQRQLGTPMPSLPAISQQKRNPNHILQ